MGTTMPPKQHYLLLRHTTVAKDWAIRHFDGKLYIRFGRTDQVIQRRVITQGTMSRPLLEEMEERIRQKLRWGYRQIGFATFEDGCMIPVGSETTAGGALHWRVSDPLPPVGFMGFVRSVSDRLTGWGHTISPIVRPQAGLRLYLAGGIWDLGTQKGGGFKKDLRGGGAVPKELGPAPVLILMALARAFPGAVTFTDDRGNPFTPTISVNDPFLGPQFAVVPSLASRLGLGPAPLPVAVLDSADSSPSYWFE